VTKDNGRGARQRAFSGMEKEWRQKTKVINGRYTKKE
jgi:hypothetical protein